MRDLPRFFDSAIVDALLIGVHFAFAFGGVGDYCDMSLAASGGYSEQGRC